MRFFASQAYAIAGILYFILIMGPWTLLPPREGLDPSWQSILDFSFRSSLQWGTDIIFTYGPLGLLYVKLFSAETFSLIIFFWLALGLVLGLVLVILLSNIRIIPASVLFLLFSLPLTYSIDTRLLLLPLIVVIGYFAPKPVPMAFLLLLTFFSGIASLIKFSFGVVGLVLFVALDVDLIIRRRLPMFCITFATAFLAAYGMSGQSYINLGPLLRGYLATTSGYSEAMQLWGSPYELALFLLTCFFLLLLAYRLMTIRNSTTTHTLILVVCLLYFLFITFKAGFVRHDLHSLISWSCLASALAFLITINWQFLNRNVSFALLAVASLFSTAPAIILLSDSNLFLIFDSSVRQPKYQIKEATKFIFSRSEWLQTKEEWSAQTKNQLAQSLRDLDLNGTLDTIPSIQSSILAAGIAYSPRPTIQEYMTYNAYLSDASLRFIEGARAPQYMLHNAGSIDNRYPSSADGALWFDLFRLYKPTKFVAGNVLLDRRSHPLVLRETSASKTTVMMNEDIIVTGDGLIFASVTFNKTLFGRMLDTVFKPGLLYITVTLENNTKKTYRLVPEIARAGFLLSPLVDTNIILAAVALGEKDLVKRNIIRSVRFHADNMAMYSYNPEIEMALRYVDPTELANSPRSIDMENAINRGRLLLEAAESSNKPEPFVSLYQSELFAHAPATLYINLPGDGSLSVGFGIRRGAYEGNGQTDGVCFRVLQGTRLEDSTPLWERCLHPTEDQNDRGEQSVDISISRLIGNKLFFETKCIDNCNWDWSYWKYIDYTHRQ